MLEGWGWVGEVVCRLIQPTLSSLALVVLAVLVICTHSVTVCTGQWHHTELLQVGMGQWRHMELFLVEQAAMLDLDNSATVQSCHPTPLRLPAPPSKLCRCSSSRHREADLSIPLLDTVTLG